MNKFFKGAIPRRAGEWAETLAERFLTENSFEILDRNYKIRHGELDIIARDGGMLVFVEVKYLSKDSGMGYPEERVTLGKQRRMQVAAGAWMASQRQDGPARFDVIALSGDLDEESLNLQHYIDAFS